MTVQQTSHAGVNFEVAARPPADPARRVRRLPKQKDWPLWMIVGVQVGILVAAVALWQAELAKKQFPTMSLDDLKATLARSFDDEMWSKDGTISRASWTPQSRLSWAPASSSRM